MPRRSGTPGCIALNRSRGISLIEVMIAVSILTLIFLFIAQSLVASSRTLSVDVANSTQIAAANYYMGLMKSDSEFWNEEQTGWTTGGAIDMCGNQLTPYDDSFPSPPAQPNWHPVPACSSDPVPQNDPNHNIKRVEYMWSASPNPSNGFAADLAVWVKTTDSTGDHIYETHAMRYQNPVAGSPPVPTPTGGNPSSSPPPPPSPTPTPSPKPSPSGTPVGI